MRLFRIRKRYGFKKPAPDTYKDMLADKLIQVDPTDLNGVVMHLQNRITGDRFRLDLTVEEAEQLRKHV